MIDKRSEMAYMMDVVGFKSTRSPGYLPDRTLVYVDLPALDDGGRPMPPPLVAPRRVYKYVDLDDAHFLEAGNVKIGSFKQFAALKGPRADSDETKMRYKDEHRRFINLNPGDPGTEKLLALGYEVMGPMRGIEMDGNSFEFSAPDSFCLCFSDRPDIVRPDGKPQAVFRVLNLRRLVKRLCTFHGLEGYRTGRVRYGARDGGDPFEATAVGPNPFLKPADFIWEREVRAVFSANGPEPLPTLTGADEEVRLLLQRLPDIGA